MFTAGFLKLQGLPFLKRYRESPKFLKVSCGLLIVFILVPRFLEVVKGVIMTKSLGIPSLEDQVMSQACPLMHWNKMRGAWYDRWTGSSKKVLGKVIDWI